MTSRSLLALARLSEDQWDDWAKATQLLSDVEDELANQMEKWGVQDKAFPDKSWAGYYAFREEYAKRDSQHSNNSRWDFILLEEVYEALAARNPEEMYSELIQVAAVAVNMARNLIRNQEEE